MLELDRIYCMNCLDGMKNIDDASISMIITSPPYNCGKEYEEDMSDYEYRNFLKPIFKEMYRILKNDGRFAINTAFNMIRHSDVKETVYPFLAIVDTIRENGLKIKEDIIWDQCNSGSLTAWGSWLSASSPFIRHLTEHILIGYKEQWKKTNGGNTDINPQEFMRYTLDKWRFVSKKEVDHPAPFPQELPFRCIKLFTYENDIVVDPFNGSGTTSVVCKKLNRRFIGFENNLEYCKMAEKRLLNIPERLETFSCKLGD